MSTEEDKERLMNQILGKGGGRRASDVKPVSVMSTGIWTLDRMVLGGGIMLGRMIELAGETGSGKTTFAMHLAAKMQREGGLIGWVDAETSFDPEWAMKTGLDPTTVMLRDFGSGEDLLRWVKSLVVLFGEGVGKGLIIVDSVAGLIPQIVVDRENEHMKMNEQQARATMLGAFCADMISTFKVKNTDLGIDGYFRMGNYDVSIVFINHLKEGMPNFQGGPPKNYTSGGSIKNFAAAQRLWMYRRGRSKEVMGDGVGVRKINVRFKTDKNRLAPPFARHDLLLDHELATFEEDHAFLLDESVRLGLAEKSGSWITIAGFDKFQGVEKFKMFCEEHPEFLERVVSGSGQAQTPDGSTCSESVT